MDQNIDDMIRHISRQEGISEQKVLDEMQRAIDAGYSDPTPSVRAQWARMPFDGKPTPQELIIYLANEARRDDMN